MGRIGFSHTKAKRLEKNTNAAFKFYKPSDPYLSGVRLMTRGRCAEMNNIQTKLSSSLLINNLRTDKKEKK